MKNHTSLSGVSVGVLALALSSVLGGSCSYRGKVESKNSESVTPQNGAGLPMLTSPQALEIGYSAIKSSPEREKPGDIVAEPTPSGFRVRFFFVISQDRKLDHLVEVSLDAESGKNVKTEDKGRVAGLQERSADEGWEKFLSGKHAYDLAVAALKGFENYDKQGPLTVELRKDIYYVTFPLKRTPDMGSRVSAYAMQVWIDARSGKVLKVLAAS